MNVDQFFELVSNAEKYKAKLDEIRKAEAAAKEVIALVGPANEIIRMRAIAQTEVDKVAAQVAELRKAFDAEVKEGKAKIQKKQDELTDKQSVLAKKEKALAEQEEKIALAQATVQKALDDASTRAASLEEVAAGLRAKEAELSDRLAKLKALAG